MPFSCPIPVEFNPSGYWKKYTLSYSDLAVAATTNNIEVLSLNVGVCVNYIVLKTTTVFASPGTYTMTVGYTGSTSRYIASTNLKTAVSGTFFSVSATSSQGPVNFGFVTSIRAYATSSVNLDLATTGVVDLYFYLSDLAPTEK